MSLSRRTLLLSATATPFVLNMPVAARQATGTPDSASATDRSAAMLQYVPGGKLDGSLFVIWNDYATQVAAIQQNAPDAASEFSDDDLAMMSTYVTVPDFAMYAKMLPDLAGYAFGQIGQALSFGSVPDSGLVMELDVDAEELVAFWESAGYEERENEYGSFWTIGEEGEVDLTNEIQRSMLAKFNNVAVLSDGVLAYTSTSSLLAEMQAVAAGEAENASAELDPITSSLPVDTTSFLIVSGEELAMEAALAAVMLAPEQLAALEESIAESDEVVGVMPAVRTVCVGATAGGSMEASLRNPEAQEFILLELDAADQAEQAADVITWRAENMQSLITQAPYSELLPDLELEALTGEKVICTSPMEMPRSIFANMIMSRDVLLFAW